LTKFDQFFYPNSSPHINLPIYTASLATTPRANVHEATAAMLMPSLTQDALAADDSWTEVLRVSTGCIMNGDQPLRYSDGEPFTEGKNRGWPGDAGKAAYSFHPAAASHRGRWPYGCWFYLVKGAGVFVNVGRSLRALTRLTLVKNKVAQATASLFSEGCF
jgi:hypothetical protein